MYWWYCYHFWKDTWKFPIKTYNKNKVRCSEHINMTIQKLHLVYYIHLTQYNTNTSSPCIHNYERGCSPTHRTWTSTTTSSLSHSLTFSILLMDQIQNWKTFRLLQNIVKEKGICQLHLHKIIIKTCVSDYHLLIG